MPDGTGTSATLLQQEWAPGCPDPQMTISQIDCAKLSIRVRMKQRIKADRLTPASP